MSRIPFLFERARAEPFSATRRLDTVAAACALAVCLVGTACHDEPLASALPAIEVDEVALDFHTVQTLTTATDVLTIENPRKPDLVVDSVVVVQTGTAFAVSPTELRVGRYSSSTLTVTFTPPTDGPHTGELVIDSNAENAPVLRISLSGSGAQVCGNGAADPGEDCDDGSLNSDQAPNACRTDCTLPACGDGVVDDAYGEACDEGQANSNDSNAACRLNCALPGCGDGVLDDGEGCDDGDGDLTDDCPDGPQGTCQPARCGDGFVQTGVETCDDGNDLLTDACPDGDSGTCLDAACGDGFVQAGIETCDDGNGVLTDACPDGEHGTCLDATCGDGFVHEGHEACDDPDINLCSPTCECEGDFTFTATTGTAPGAIDVAVSFAAGGCQIGWQRLEIRRSILGEAPVHCYDGLVIRSFSTFDDASWTDVTGYPGGSFGYRACLVFDSGDVDGTRSVAPVATPADPAIEWRHHHQTSGVWSGNYYDDVPRDGRATDAVVLSDGTSYVVGFQDELLHNRSSWDVWIRKFDENGTEIIAGWDKRIDFDWGKDEAFAVAADSTGIYVAVRSDALPDTLLLRFAADGTRLFGDFAMASDVADLAVDAADNLWVVGGSGDGNLTRYDPTGAESFSTTLELGNGRPKVLHINAEGELFVGGGRSGSSSWDGFVKKLDADGTEIVTGWDKSIDYGATEHVHALATDSSGALYVGGCTGSSFNYDAFVKKYSAAGVEDTDGWGAVTDLGHWEYAINSLAVDSSDNIYATGHFNQSLQIRKFEPDGTEITSGWDKRDGYPVYSKTYDGGGSFALAILPDDRPLVGIPGYTYKWLRAYSPQGAELSSWSTTLPPLEGDDTAAGLAVMSDGRVWFGGVTHLREVWGSPGYPAQRRASTLIGLSSAGEPTGDEWIGSPFLESGTLDVQVGSDGAIYALRFGGIVRRFDPTDLTIDWQTALGSSAGLSGRSLVPLALDSSDNVYVGNTDRNLISASSGADWEIRKLSSAGDKDSTWTKLFDDASVEELVADSDDNVYAMGAISGSAGTEWWIKKYAASGTEITSGWDKQFSAGGSGGATAAAVDASDALYVAGSYGNGWTIKKFLSDGTEVTEGWDLHIAGAPFDRPEGVAVDSAKGLVYVAGVLSNQVTLQSGPDFYVVKLTVDGEAITTGGWPRAHDGGYWGEDAAQAVIVQPDGSVLVSGYVYQRLAKHSGKDALVMQLAGP